MAEEQQRAKEKMPKRVDTKRCNAIGILYREK